MRKLVFLASFAGLSLADPASATIIKLINFDDLPIPDSAPYAHIPNPYAGFDWSPHFMYLEGGAGYLYPGGYQNFDVSAPTNVAFNGGGRNGAAPPPVNFSRRMPFELDSFDLAAAWRDGLEVTVTGELCSPPASPQTCVVVDSTTLTVDDSGPTLETFNWGDVNKVVFQSVPGSGVPVGFTDGFQFVLGNVRINPRSAPRRRQPTSPRSRGPGTIDLGLDAARLRWVRGIHTFQERSARFAGRLANVRSTRRQVAPTSGAGLMGSSGFVRRQG